MKPAQPSLFEPEPPTLPDGLRYRTDVITPDQERELVEQFRALPFAALEFREYVGKQRIVSFGSKYDFSEERLLRADEIPPFLLPLRESVAAFAGLDAADLQQVLVTEYEAGAAIGWHRDKPVLEEVAGVSLLSPCVFRLRREIGSGWTRASLTLRPRSAYLLSGPSRTEWEHSIPAVSSSRYSVTFRTLRSGRV